MKKKTYYSPSVQIEEVKIERGFADSAQNDYAPSGQAGMLQEGETYDF